jgi:Arylsulfotransferase (ASST)
MKGRTTSVSMCVAYLLALSTLFLSSKNLIAEKKVGLTISSDKAYKSFTLYPEEGTATVKLLSSKGEVVHSWPVDASRARLLPNCNLLVVHGTKWGNQREPWRSLRKSIIEYDWNNQPVWRYNNEEVLHHDVHRLKDKETIFLKRSFMPNDIQLQIQDPTRRNRKQRADSIMIVDAAGKTLFQWDAFRHLDIDYAGPDGFTKVSRANGAEFRVHDWTHMNTAAVLPKNKWYDGGDQRFKPGNIISHVRNWSRSIIIDRDTKDVVWEYDGDYKGGLGGGHDPHMIPEGREGAGNILVFDNGKLKHRKHSFVLEVNPVNKNVVWSYEHPDFFSFAGGALERLPNGNTLISEDRTGRVLEVNKKKEIVWEYRGEKKLNRATKYSYDYCPMLTPELDENGSTGIMARIKNIWDKW